MKSTKIICTMGPSCREDDVLCEMIKAGMDIARLNMSHGDHAFHKEMIERLRRVSGILDKPVGILMDLQGPKIRTGKLEKDFVELKTADLLTLTTADIRGNWTRLSVNYKNLPMEAKIGEKIYLDDGNVELRVLEIEDTSLLCKIINGGVIHSYRGINLPDTKISLPALTKKDMKDLEFGLTMGVDFVALSFVRHPGDILDLKRRISKRDTPPVVVAKIEKPEAISYIDEIINVADAIMVARGDLGAETSPQEVPILQKMIIRKCNKVGKPVITATQMMESMHNNPRPTRAEAGDVANAIFDGTDAVMLSGETAMGTFPIKTVKVMADIALRTEEEIFKKKHTPLAIPGQQLSVAASICFSACQLSRILDTVALVAFTISGSTATIISRYRPAVPVIAMSPDQRVLRKLCLYWGIHGIEIETVDTSEALIDLAEIHLLQKKLCEDSDRVIMVGGVPVMSKVETNMVKVHRVSLGERNF